MSKETQSFRRRTVLKTIGGATCISFIGSAAAQQGCDLVVNPNSNSPQQYDTIQSAVDAANTGDTICITNDTYNEAVVISTDGLTLRAPRGNATVETSVSAQNNRAIKIDGASDVTIDGLAITFDSEQASNSEKYAIRAPAGSDNLTVKNCTIGDFSSEDVDTNSGAVRASGVVVTAVQGSSSASRNTETQGPTVTNNTIENITCTGQVDPSNTDSDSKAKGVALNGNVPGAVVENNTIHDIGTVSNDPPGAQDALTDNAAVGTAKPRGISLVEDPNGDGPKNFEIVANDFDGIEGTYGQPAIFIGGTNALGSAHRVNQNNIRHPVDNLSAGEPLNVENNWWGDSDGPEVVAPDQDNDGGTVVDRGGGSGTDGTKYDWEPFLDSENNQAGANP